MRIFSSGVNLWRVMHSLLLSSDETPLPEGAGASPIVSTDFCPKSVPVSLTIYTGLVFEGQVSFPYGIPQGKACKGCKQQR
jgi:hypothetical protein